MKSILLTLLFGLSSQSHAGAVSQLGEGDPLRLVFVEMQYLYRAGIEIHEQFTDPEDPIQMSYCKGQYNYILTRARSLIGTAGQMEKGELRDKVLDAGWQVYACASCNTPASSCDPVPENIEMIKQAIQQKESSDKTAE